MFECWAPVSGMVWEGLGGVALLEEVCLWLSYVRSPHQA
ncbi:hypothetical protein LEMLEM_LOCUS16377 [Lemmus lemmus]